MANFDFSAEQKLVFSIVKDLEVPFNAFLN